MNISGKPDKAPVQLRVYISGNVVISPASFASNTYDHTRTAAKITLAPYTNF